MYTQINPVKELEQLADQTVLDNDRLLYRPFFERAELFCAENNILIGGRVGIDLLVGREVHRDSFFWELYCDDTFNNAKTLANALYKTHSPHVPARTVSLRTDIKHREFTISVNTRFLFRFYSLDKYRGLKLVNVMGPAARSSYFTHTQIKLIPEEIQLIDVYRTLYSPVKVSMWKDELENENKIYELIQDYIDTKAISEITGGGNDLRHASRDMSSLLLEKILSGDDHVVIGDYALAALGLENSPSRMQFITKMDIDTLTDHIGKLFARSYKHFAKFKTTYVKYSLNIPSDFQILKYTIYLNDGKEKTAIADVFNSGQFEMIPFTRTKIQQYAKCRIGNPWVLLRFLFIDIWTLKLILNIGKDNPEYIKNKIKTNIRRANALREIILKDLTSSFQLTDYIGTFINETVAKRKLIKELDEKIPTYYPANSQTVEVEEQKDVSLEGEIIGGINS